MISEQQSLDTPGGLCFAYKVNKKLKKIKENSITKMAVEIQRGMQNNTLSTLAKESVKDYFLPRIWVCMSRQPDEDCDNRKETIRRMLVCLRVEDEVINSADDSHGLPGLLCALSSLRTIEG
ncbi:unnamed protein product [Ilex paraguariensis]|uniref:Uncharacterized protein n=1 Tax=Ilex paraguariensis TaxID=185542 RepID=A0ABC8UJV8_9AQUA